MLDQEITKKLQALSKQSRAMHEEANSLRLQRGLVPSKHNAQYVVVDRNSGILSPRKRDKLVIVGSYKEHHSSIPWEDPEWEIWGMNRFWLMQFDYEGRLRADRWFEMHPVEVQEPIDLQFMRQCPVPLYMLKAYTPAQFPNGVVYPLETVSQSVPHKYFTSTFAYQMALAICEGFQEILLAGIIFNGGRERLVERPCFEFWCGVAIGRGIRIRTVEPTPDFVLPWFRSPQLYGYNYHEEKQAIEQHCHGSIPHIVHDAFFGSK